MKQLKWLTIPLLWLFFALLVGGSVKTYMTADEGAYIAGGYVYFAQGPTTALPFLTQRGYPPFLAGLEGLFLYLHNPHIPLETIPGWPEKYDLFFQGFVPYAEPIPQTLLMARLPLMWLMMLVAAAIYRWGQQLWGVPAGLLALFALALDPTLLAHGRLAHTDAGVMGLGTLALFLLWQWSKKPSWLLSFGTGLLLGLAVLSKISGLFWLAAAGFGGLLVLWRTPRWVIVGQGLLMLGTAVLLFWAAYLFGGGEINGWWVPAADYWRSMLYLRSYIGSVVALGRRWYEPIWWYYPLAFLIKNPLPFLVGLLVGFITLFRSAKPRPESLLLWFFPLFYTGIALLEGMNIGYRHFLPVHPYLHLVIGGGVMAWVSSGRPWRWGMLAAGCLFYGWGAWAIFPSEIAYFNELVGGPSQGYRYLTDSNLDWGQISPAEIHQFLADRPGLAYEPPLHPFRPAAGQYLIGATHLYGVGLDQQQTYTWFQNWPVQEQLGYALLVYDVPPFTTHWVAQCYKPLEPLTREELTAGLGSAPPRQLSFDCLQSWVYPAGSGIYALHADLFLAPEWDWSTRTFGAPTAADNFVREQLTPLRLSFHKRHKDSRPTFLLFEATQQNRPTFSLPYEPAGVDTPPQTLTFTSPAEVVLDGRVRFLGAKVAQVGGEWQVQTGWQLLAEVEKPAAVMAHLTAGDGFTLQNGDGLGVDLTQLRPGDLFVQRHIFATPTQPVWLRTGIYWAENTQLWTISPNQNSIFVKVNP